MSDEREQDARTPVNWRARLIEVFVECDRDMDFGQSGDDATDIIHHIIKLRKERDEAIQRATEAEAWNAIRDSAAAKERNQLMQILFERDVDPAYRIHLVRSLKTKLDWLNKTLNRLDLAGVWTGADALLDDRVAQLILDRDATGAENDRLTTERDQALHRIEQLYASTVSQGVHDKMVDLYNRAIDERDQAREQLAKLRAACKDVPDMLEYSLDYLARNEAVRSFRRAAAAIHAALGIESEAGDVSD